MQQQIPFVSIDKLKPMLTFLMCFLKKSIS